MAANLREIESELRRAFADGAACARQPSLSLDEADPVRASRSVRRRRLLMPAAAAVAVIAVLAAAVAIPRALHAGTLTQTEVPPGTPIAYLATYAGTVVRIDAASGRVLTTITLPQHGFPHGMFISANHKIICVLSKQFGKGDYLTRVNAATGEAAVPVLLPHFGDSVAITPDGRTAYVLTLGAGVPAQSWVTPVSLTTGALRKSVGVLGAFAMAISPDDRMLYVSATPDSSPDGRNGQEVVPIRTATNTALAPIRLSAPGYAEGIAVSPDGRTVYVATLEGNPGKAAVTPIITATDTPMPPIPVQQPNYASGLQLSVSPDGRTAYAYGGSSYIDRIDLASGQRLPPVVLPSFLAIYDFQISPDGRTGYAYWGYPAIVPVDLVTGKVLRRITVAPRPYQAFETFNSQLSFIGGDLYAGVAYGVHPVFRKGFGGHAAISVIQLSTGKIRVIRERGLWLFMVVVRSARTRPPAQP